MFSVILLLCEDALGGSVFTPPRYVYTCSTGVYMKAVTFLGCERCCLWFEDS